MVIFASEDIGLVPPQYVSLTPGRLNDAPPRSINIHRNPTMRHARIPHNVISLRNPTCPRPKIPRHIQRIRQSHVRSRPEHTRSGYCACPTVLARLEGG
jgi:hypothetical protein